MMRALALLLFATSVFAQPIPYAPDRRPGEGEGPFPRLIIRGAALIDGTGAPPVGPVDIVIEGNRIKKIDGVGFPKVPFDPDRRLNVLSLSRSRPPRAGQTDTRRHEARGAEAPNQRTAARRLLGP